MNLTLESPTLLTRTCQPEEIIEHCYRLLGKTGSNVVWEILRQSEVFLEWNHYPKGDVFDKASQCQYYYHTHPPSEHRLPEHGHFHLFMRPKGIPPQCQPTPIPSETTAPKTSEAAPCHLIAISMDRFGKPIRLFTTNRWVTGETWYPAEAICAMIDCFIIDHTYPSWPTNLWLSALIRWFAPEIKQLIYQRDEVVANWQKALPSECIYENRNLEVISHMDIAIEP